MCLGYVFNPIRRVKRLDLMAQKLFSETKLGNLTLQNRIVKSGADCGLETRDGRRSRKRRQNFRAVDAHRPDSAPR